MNLAELPPVLLRSLRRMDAEAATIRDGYPTGLNWYAGHARPELRKPQTEPAWSARLAELLRAHGVEARSEVRYPGARQKCDLVVACDDAPRVWVEVKGAWKHYWAKQGGRAIYRTYLVHPLVDTGMAKSHTAAHDITKIASLTKADADAVALLLVGFDHISDPMAPDIAEFAALAALHAPDWSVAEDHWPDARRADEHAHAWTWWRSLGH